MPNVNITVTAVTNFFPYNVVFVIATTEISHVAVDYKLCLQYNNYTSVPIIIMTSHAGARHGMH